MSEDGTGDYRDLHEGDRDIIPYHLLSSPPYLKNDTLYFKVTIDLDDYKPWLQCSIESS